MQIYFPYQITSTGTTATTGYAQHVRDLIEQILFTAPGERVNRPLFGTGLQQMVFAPDSDELATATEFMVQGALIQWLGELIQVESVTVEAGEAKLAVTVCYMLLLDQQQHRVEIFERQVLTA
jgi:hypothetical protein